AIGCSILLRLRGVHRCRGVGAISSRSALNKFHQAKPLSRFDELPGTSCGPCIIARHSRGIRAMHVDHVAGELLTGWLWVPGAEDSWRRRDQFAEALTQSIAVQVNRSRGLPDFIDDEAHAQHMPRTIDRTVLELLARDTAALDARTPLSIPDDRPPIAVIAPGDRQAMPTGAGIRLARRLLCLGLCLCWHLEHMATTRHGVK